MRITVLGGAMLAGAALSPLAMAQSAPIEFESDLEAVTVIAAFHDTRAGTDSEDVLYEVTLDNRFEKVLQNGLQIGGRLTLRGQRDHPARPGFLGRFGGAPGPSGAYSGLSGEGSTRDTGARGQLEAAYLEFDGGYGELRIGRDRGLGQSRPRRRRSLGRCHGIQVGIDHSRRHRCTLGLVLCQDDDHGLGPGGRIGGLLHYQQGGLRGIHVLRGRPLGGRRLDKGLGLGERSVGRNLRHLGLGFGLLTCLRGSAQRLVRHLGRHLLVDQGGRNGEAVLQLDLGRVDDRSGIGRSSSRLGGSLIHDL